MGIYQVIIGVLLTLLGMAGGYALSHTSIGKEVTKGGNRISHHESDIKTLFKAMAKNEEMVGRCMAIHTEMLTVTRELVSQNTILIHQKIGDG